VKSAGPRDRWLVVVLSAIALGVAWFVPLLDQESNWIPPFMVAGREAFLVVVLFLIANAVVSAVLLFLRKSAVFLISLLASLVALWRVLLVLAT
jgi:hypothetical protein